MDGWCFDEFWEELGTINFGARWGGNTRLLCALRMHSDGMRPSDLRALVKCARERSETPARLLGHWLQSPVRWKEVLLDIRDAEKHARVYRRADEDWLRVKIPAAISKALSALGF